ncbi:MAG: KamA family radical SAM protein [Coriobacteriia bacterium]
MVVRDVRSIAHLAQVDVRRASRVAERYPFRANDYYLSLIDPADPEDPIRNLVVPREAELHDHGSLDASQEALNTKLRGLQHKYRDTAVLLVTDQCACFCRYCFRKRLFEPGSREATRETSRAIQYISQHPEITDVLVTGGDPLILPTHVLAETLHRLLVIPHVRTIRIGTKMPAFDPGRIVGDEGLLRLLGDVTAAGRALYVMTHFDHPREVTGLAREALDALQSVGAQCLNQCPITRGVNDDVGVLAELHQVMTEVGSPQYYVFQCRPTKGNSAFTVPIVESFSILAAARERLSGLSRRSRLCMSHSTGKVEVVGVDDRAIYARYHRAKDPADEGRMLVLKRDDSATWLDDLEPLSA